MSTKHTQDAKHGEHKDDKSRLRPFDSKADSSVWFSVTILSHANFSSSMERRLNVERMKAHIPTLSLLEGSLGIDASCCSVLHSLNIRVSAYYNTWEKGVGWIHNGKLGHWCSFLRFLQSCAVQNTTFCVWLEDDCNLDQKLLQVILNNLHSTKLILALGEGDEVNVITKDNAIKLLKFYTNYKVALPFDLATRKDQIRHDIHLFDARLFHSKQKSSIVCETCEIMHYTEANLKIDSCHGFIEARSE